MTPNGCSCVFQVGNLVLTVRCPSLFVCLACKFVFNECSMFSLLVSVNVATHADSVRETPGRFQKMWSASNALNHGPSGFLHHDRMSTQIQPADSGYSLPSSTAGNAHKNSKMDSFLSVYK
mmetsp:Transcript_4987/g.10146  ORF Transcript_4987/g.10146 Transcript_4987/m.10146 type:complete len:121 (-) Transcript_4987:608-970(-)